MLAGRTPLLLGQAVQGQDPHLTDPLGGVCWTELNRQTQEANMFEGSPDQRVQLSLATHSRRDISMSRLRVDVCSRPKDKKYTGCVLPRCRGCFRAHLLCRTGTLLLSLPHRWHRYPAALPSWPQLSTAKQHKTIISFWCANHTCGMMGCKLARLWDTAAVCCAVLCCLCSAAHNS